MAHFLPLLLLSLLPIFWGGGSTKGCQWRSGGNGGSFHQGWQRKRGSLRLEPPLIFYKIYVSLIKILLCGDKRFRRIKASRGEWCCGRIKPNLFQSTYIGVALLNIAWLVLTSRLGIHYFKVRSVIFLRLIDHLTAHEFLWAPPTL